ncbi:MAG: FAD-dependent oxidoreductase [Balneolaceae bacterium]
MKIGIIGAGIAGLSAGRELAKAGHQVSIIEKSQKYGGRLATDSGELHQGIWMDYGIPCFTAESPEFSGFISELLDKEKVKVWENPFSLYDGEQFHMENPNPTGKLRYTSVEGMNSIAAYLGRWVDLQLDVKAGGLTYFGPHRRLKKAWMINLTNFNTFEADAVIVATPAPQAYGVILTCQDEVNTLKIIREIDEIHYDPAFTMRVTYGNRQIPSWPGVICQDDRIEFISNESSKRNDSTVNSIVIRSTSEFALKFRNVDEEQVKEMMLDRVSAIIGGWTATPDKSKLHFWRYYRPKTFLNRPFMDFEGLESPLALVGDYFNGNNADAAYSSGIKLARHWIKKYEGVKA